MTKKKKWLLIGGIILIVIIALVIALLFIRPFSNPMNRFSDFEGMNFEQLPIDGTGEYSERGPGGFGGMGSIDIDTIKEALEDQGIDTSFLDDVDSEDFSFQSLMQLIKDLPEEQQQAIMQAVMGNMGAGNFGGFGQRQGNAD